MYKLLVIKSFYVFATQSMEDKQEDRFGQVVTQCNEFIDRFPDSKLTKTVQEYLNLSQNNLKALKNEQVKKTS